jgi:hypothetical protein
LGVGLCGGGVGGGGGGVGRITGFAWSLIKFSEVLYQKCTNFPKIYEPPQISRHPNGDMKVFPS